MSSLLLASVWHSTVRVVDVTDGLGPVGAPPPEPCPKMRLNMTALAPLEPWLLAQSTPCPGKQTSSPVNGAVNGRIVSILLFQQKPVHRTQRTQIQARGGAA